ncbi:MAG: hypothetical protein GVY18_04545 [Bacteroidetes bacterium]|jgi:hypothetical protein|nr:hypothetical protein [Bacteroidota bacterium]
MPQTHSQLPKIPLPDEVPLPDAFDCGHDPRDPAACATCALVVATLAAEQRWSRQTPSAEVPA